MSYMNIVKFKVKTESVEAFKAQAFTPKHFEGMIEEHYVQTDVNDYAVVGLWQSEEKLVAARPAMIEFLDSIRHMLEELSPELGVTDAVSGTVVYCEKA